MATKVLPKPAVKGEAQTLASATNGWANDAKPHESDDSALAINGDREPFFTTPWYYPGHKIRGMDQSKLFVNENAVRARAGLLMGFAFVVITLLAALEAPSKVVPYMAIPVLLDVSILPLLTRPWVQYTHSKTHIAYAR